MKTRWRRRTTARGFSLPETESALEREQQDFERRRARLIKRYPGEYVALQGGQVVAHDRDDEALAARMFARVDDAPFFIAHVVERTSGVEVPSPELVR